MGKRKLNKKEELEQHVTVGMLLEYTDSFLVPKFAEITGSMMDERFKQFESKVNLRFAEQEYRFKDYLDKKFATFESDLTKRYDRRYVLKKA